MGAGEGGVVAAVPVWQYPELVDSPWSRWPPDVEAEFRSAALEAVGKAGLDESDDLQSLEERCGSVNRVVASEYWRWRLTHSAERRAVRRANRRPHWYESGAYGLWIVVLVAIWACTTGVVFAETSGVAVSLADALAGWQSKTFPGGRLCDGGPGGWSALAAAGRDTGIMLAALIPIALVLGLRLQPIGEDGEGFFPSLRAARVRRARHAREAREVAHGAWLNALQNESMLLFLSKAPSERSAALRSRALIRHRRFATLLLTRTLNCIAAVAWVLAALVGFFAFCFGVVQTFEWLTVLTGGRPTLCLNTSPGIHALSSLIVAVVAASPVLIWLRRHGRSPRRRATRIGR